MLPDSFQPGALLRGKYRVERVLGTGGMGVVVQAAHLDLERQVAIKVLHHELKGNGEVVERFLREGRAASRIEGEHVARVFDVDRLEDGTPFLVMELLAGRDLSFVRKERRPLEVAVALDYVLQACAAIAQAHRAGVIHRDVKPGNLFLAEGPGGATRIKVLDFGISKISSPFSTSEPSVTRTTLVMGSVEYMSPEQMLSTRNVDARTDVWALGVVLFELLTASAPFAGENTTQICAHVMSQPAVRPSERRPDLPKPLEQIILRCLEKDCEARYPTVEALEAALRELEIEATTGAQDAAASPATTILEAGSRDAASTSLLPSAISGTGVRPSRATAVALASEADAPSKRSGARVPLLLGAIALAAVALLGLAGSKPAPRSSSAATQPASEATWTADTGLVIEQRERVALEPPTVSASAPAVTPQAESTQAPAPTITAETRAPRHKAKPAGSLSAARPPTKPTTAKPLISGID